jgi:hypothetical protein
MAQTWPWVDRFIVLFFRSLARARVSRADRLEPSSVSSSHKNQIRRRAHHVQSASHRFFVGHSRGRGVITDRPCSREGPRPKAAPRRAGGPRWTSRATGPIGAARQARASAPWWFGLTMSASLPGKLLAANGSCARAMTVDGCARGPAQWPAPCSASNKA